MSAVLQLVQGSRAWHEHRATHRNASETPAVLGVSPWVTPYQLWLERTGRAEPQVTPAMARGTQLEPLARAAYERLTGQSMKPLVMVEGGYSASLDGIDAKRELILEVKCPAKGRESELWQLASQGQIPDHYRWQIATQLHVSGARLAHLFVYDGHEGLIVEQRPKPTDWEVIHNAWEKFMDFVAEDRPPPLTERDVRVRDDQLWHAAAAEYQEAKRLLDAASTRAEQAKTHLVGLATHASERGAGVQVTRYWKQGAVDYKRVPELAGVDLEQYRGAAREEVRVSVAK